MLSLVCKVSTYFGVYLKGSLTVTSLVPRVLHYDIRLAILELT